ncbi:MAG: hypothetical protein H6828_10590 [Planctomycetes bacterium]|nr:hypothetical protein [Planctomycetota bacterium]
MARSDLRYLLAPLLALGLAHSQAPAPGRGVPVEAAAPRFREVAPEELWAHPGQWVGKQVTLVVQAHSRPETWNPFVTRFGPGEYACLVGWSDTQWPWLREDFDAPLVRVFAKRGGAAEWALEGAARYQRFELSCEVRAVFADEPWLEVLGVKPLVRQLNDGVVLHAQRGLGLMGKELWDAARLELERAAAGTLPDAAGAELARLADLCLERRDAAERAPRRGRPLRR